MAKAQKRLKQTKKKVSTNSKGYGFWRVNKVIQNGIRLFKIVRVDDQRYEIERFGRLDFARKLVKKHNNEILFHKLHKIDVKDYRKGMNRFTEEALVGIVKEFMGEQFKKFLKERTC